MYRGILFEVKFVCLIALICLGLSIPSMEVQSVTNPHAPSALELIEKAYDGVVAYVIGNVERVKDEIASVF
jgi:hypothetical protein